MPGYRQQGRYPSWNQTRLKGDVGEGRERRAQWGMSLSTPFEGEEIPRGKPYRHPVNAVEGANRQNTRRTQTITQGEQRGRGHCSEPGTDRRCGRERRRGSDRGCSGTECNTSGLQDARSWHPNRSGRCVVRLIAKSGGVDRAATVEPPKVASVVDRKESRRSRSHGNGSEACRFSAESAAALRNARVCIHI